MATDVDDFLINFPGHVIQYLDDDQKKKNQNNNQTTSRLDYNQAKEMQKNGAGVFFSVNGFTNGRRTKDSLANSQFKSTHTPPMPTFCVWV